MNAVLLILEVATHRVSSEFNFSMIKGWIFHISIVGQVLDHVPSSLGITLAVPVRIDVLMVNGRDIGLFFFRLFLTSDKISEGD